MRRCVLDRNNYSYNEDDVEDFNEFEEYFGFGDENDDGEPKELDFG